MDKDVAAAVRAEIQRGQRLHEVAQTVDNVRKGWRHGQVGLGRVVALYYRPSTSYQIH